MIPTVNGVVDLLNSITISFWSQGPSIKFFGDAINGEKMHLIAVKKMPNLLETNPADFLISITYRRMQAFCKTCDSIQEVEKVEESVSGDTVFCVACGEEFIPDCENGVSSTPYSNYRIGNVLSVEPIAKQKDLKKVMVDVNGDSEEGSAVQIVTNAKYIEVGWKVVVALENAIVPAGSALDEDPDAIRIKATAVGGVMSRGMLCDSPMLKWTGGAKGMVQQLPESFKIGDAIPSARPRV